MNNMQKYTLRGKNKTKLAKKKINCNQNDTTLIYSLDLFMYYTTLLNSICYKIRVYILSI